MIVYVSPAEVNGGILQFSTAITKKTKVFKNCKLFLPDMVDEKFYNDIRNEVVTYNKVKTLRNKDERIYSIAEQILSFSPTIVIFLEDSILMQQLNMILYKRGIRTAVVIHDVHHHPYRNMSARRIMVDVIRRKMTKKTVKQCHSIILLSQNSQKLFSNEYKADNTVVFRLPAHVPETPPVVPKEIAKMKEKFLLFFGRVDKYKGINRLCKAYISAPQELKCKIKLVIAGKGDFSDEELSLINSDDNIKAISRFMEDGEMIWLFENSEAVVIPYIEASQSGVLPIAYKFGKPVIVSDLDGLIENVSEGKTGYIFHTDEELKEILSRSDNFCFSEKDIFDYYEENYLWENNIRKLLEDLNTNDKKGK